MCHALAHHLIQVCPREKGPAGLQNEQCIPQECLWMAAGFTTSTPPPLGVAITYTCVCVCVLAPNGLASGTMKLAESILQVLTDPTGSRGFETTIPLCGEIWTVNQPTFHWWVEWSAVPAISWREQALLCHHRVTLEFRTTNPQFARTKKHQFAIIPFVKSICSSG